MKIIQNNINQFFVDLKKNNSIKAVLFYGNEEALMLDYVTTLKKCLPNYIFENIDGENDDCVQRINNDLNTDSMFGESKLLHLNNFKKTDGKKLTEVLKNITPQNQNFIAITSFSGLDATNMVRKMFETVGHFACVGVYAESILALKTLAKTTMDDLKMQYEPSIPELIAGKFANNRSIMKQEIYKLYTYNIGANAVITPNIATTVLDAEQDVDIFTLQTLIFDKKLKHTLEILNNAQQHGVNENIVFATIAGYVKKMYTIKKALLLPDAESIDVLMRNHGIFFQQAPIIKKHITQYSIAEIVKTITRLNTLEIQIRNSALAYNYIQNFAVTQCL